jgi:trehalose 6-phosphate phosphatase
MTANAAEALALDEISLFVDADGTLLDIAPTPDEASASVELLDVLARVQRALDGALAIVSGRRIEDLDRLFSPLKLPASGIHGAQMRIMQSGPILDAGAPDISPLLDNAVRAAMLRYPGVLIEDKGKALAVHWRGAVETSEAIHRDLMRILGAASGPNLMIMRGHCVYEIKTASINKGDAVRAFMRTAPFAGRKPVFVGDDTTDIPAFAAATALGGLAFAVGEPMPGAERFFAGPREVRAWLSSLAGVEIGSARI